MVEFLRIVKNNAHYSRFQTKYRRRREGKTDYQARRRMVSQDKNKYNTPRYRLVARKTNKDVTAQIIYAKITGDVVISAAYAHELTAHGAPVGHTSYAGCYATGLLLARRTLKKLNLDKKYAGQTKPDGEDFNVEEGEKGSRPFTACLDIGLARSTTGAGVFGVMKGALDGGINVPHKPNRFPGGKKDSVDAKFHRERIFGGTVAKHQKDLLKNDPDKYNSHYSQYKKHNIAPDAVEATWAKTHASIRADPDKSRKPAKKTFKGKRHSAKQLGTAAKIAARSAKKRKFAAEAKAAPAEEEDDDEDDDEE